MAHNGQPEDSMRGLGIILAIVGVILIVAGVVRHFSSFVLSSTTHASIYIAVVGVIVLVVGALLSRSGSAS